MSFLKANAERHQAGGDGGSRSSQASGQDAGKNVSLFCKDFCAHLAICMGYCLMRLVGGKGKRKGRRGRKKKGDIDKESLTLTPMNLSLRTIHESKNTKALLQQNNTETSVVFIFFIACK